MAASDSDTVTRADMLRLTGLSAGDLRNWSRRGHLNFLDCAHIAKGKWRRFTLRDVVALSLLCEMRRGCAGMVISFEWSTRIVQRHAECIFETLQDPGGPDRFIFLASDFEDDAWVMMGSATASDIRREHRGSTRSGMLLVLNVSAECRKVLCKRAAEA